MRKKTNNKGFSIIELLVIITIITILIAIVIPMYSTYVIKTKISNTRYEVDPYIKKLSLYASTNNLFPPENDSIWKCETLNTEYVSKICIIRKSSTSADIEAYLMPNIIESGSYYKYMLNI